MLNMSPYNLAGLLTGISILAMGSLLAYYAQKNYFSKFRNKVENSAEQPDGESS